MIKSDIKRSFICFIVTAITLITTGVTIVNVPFLVNTTFLVGGEKGICRSPVPLSANPTTDYVVEFENHESKTTTNMTRSAMMSLYSMESSKKALDKRSDGAMTIELPTYLEADEQTSNNILGGGDVPCVRFTLYTYFGTLYDSVVTEGYDTFVPFGGKDSVKIMIITFVWWFVFGIMCIAFYMFHTTARRVWFRAVLIGEIVFCFVGIVAMCVMVFGSLKHPSTYENATCEFRSVDKITGNPKPLESHNHVTYYDVLVRYGPRSEFYNNGKVWNNGRLCVTSLSFSELGLLQSRTRSDKSLTVTSMWYKEYSPLTLCYKSTSGAFEQSIAPFMHNVLGKVVNYNNNTIYNNWACKVSGTRGVRLVSVGDYHESVYYYWIVWWCAFSLIPILFWVFTPLVSFILISPIYGAWRLYQYICVSAKQHRRPCDKRMCVGSPWSGLQGVAGRPAVERKSCDVEVQNVEYPRVHVGGHNKRSRHSNSVDMENMSFV